MLNALTLREISTQRSTICSKNIHILLLIDNHSSHTSLEAIEYSRENRIVLLSFPPHCSHRLQPLDVGVFGQFKNALKVVLLRCIREQQISIKHIPTPQLENVSRMYRK